MRVGILLLLCCHAAPLPAGQAPDLDPPVVGQPPRFSGIVAMDTLSIAMEAKSPTRVAVEEPILVHLRLQGKTMPKHAPTLERLHPFAPEDASAFYIEPAPEETRSDPRQGQWIFGFRLRPKSTQAKYLPMPEIAYYSARTRSFEHTLPLEDEIKIDVQPRSEAAPAARVAEFVIPAGWQAPLPDPGEEWFRLAEPGPTTALVVFLAPPAAALAWFVMRRRGRGLKAEGSRLLRQSLRRTLAEIERSATLEEGVDVLTRYLRDRLHWSCAAPTPAEIERQLRRLGAARDLGVRFGDLFRRTDDARFGGVPYAIADWRERARNLVIELEAEPCAARLDASY